jgi:hypothetical protein
MAITVGPDNARPSHHIKLTLGSDELGLILCDSEGNKRDRADRTPYPSTAIKTYSGDAKYSDREPPFIDLIQDDWSLGRGQEDFQDDKSRYQDAQVVDTTLENKMILAGLPTYSKGIRDWEGYMPGSVEWQGMYGTQRYLAREFSRTPGFDNTQVEICVRKRGNPVTTSLSLALRSANRLTTYKVDTIDLTGVTEWSAVWYLGTWAAYTLASGTTYNIVVFANTGGDDVDNCWEIACQPWQTGDDLKSYKSSDGTSWNSTSAYFGIYFRALDADSDFTAHFAEYKDQVYFVTQKDDDSAAKLFMNGARGACDDNTGNLDRLEDSTQAGWSSLQPGNVAKISGGISYARETIQDWRDIIGKGTGYVTVDPDWKIAHNQWMNYVILGSDWWYERSQSHLTKPCTDIEIANNMMWIAQGSGNNVPMYAHREVNNNGVFEWTDTTIECWQKVGVETDFITAVLDYISGPILYMGSNVGLPGSDGIIVRDIAPAAWMNDDVNFGARRLVPADAIYDEQSVANVTKGMDGSNTYLKVADPFTTGVIGSYQASPTIDIRYITTIVVNVKSSIHLAAGVLELVLDDTANCASPLLALPMPDLSAGVWEEPITINIDAFDISGADVVRSIGWRLTQDVDAVDLYFHWGVRAYSNFNEIHIPDTKITNMIAYGEPPSCWVLCEDQLGEIRNSLYQPVPLEELKSVKSDENGRAALVHEVYLYFSLMDGLEKYYRQHLDDIGPNRDQGIPEGRRGPIVDLAGFPGRIYAAVDGGFNGYSSVMCYNGGGWHEVYRSRFIGRRIRKLFIQSIPGRTHRRLWISEGSDILWIPIAINPLLDSEYEYTFEGSMVASRIYGGMQDVSKFFKSVKMATKNLDPADGVEIYLDYKTDSSPTWTRISGAYDISPFEELNLSSAMDVAGRWIEIRVVLNTGNSFISPEVYAHIIKAIRREESKYANTYTFRVKDWDRDLNGDPIDETVTSFMAKLESMIDDPLPLYINSISDLEDSQYAVAQPASLRRLPVVLDEDGKEIHICQLTLLEI